MGTIVFPLAFVIVGLVVYAIANGKAATMALYLYICGLFWLTYLLCGRSVHLP